MLEGLRREGRHGQTSGEAQTRVDHMLETRCQSFEGYFTSCQFLLDAASRSAAGLRAA